MNAELFMATMVVLSGGGFVDNVVSGVQDVADDIGNAVNDAIEKVNSVGQTIGNGLETIRESPGDGPIVGGDPDEYTEERYLANDSIEELTETLNTREKAWVTMDKSVIQGNITENEVINVVVITEDSTAIGANYTVHMNWSNVTVANGSATISGTVVEAEAGHAPDPDLTVYPTVADIEYATENYEQVSNLSTRAEVGSELWERVDNMRCEPVGKCSHLKTTYQEDLVFEVIGGLAR